MSAAICISLSKCLHFDHLIELCTVTFDPRFSPFVKTGAEAFVLGNVTVRSRPDDSVRLAIVVRHHPLHPHYPHTLTHFIITLFFICV